MAAADESLSPRAVNLRARLEAKKQREAQDSTDGDPHEADACRPTCVRCALDVAERTRQIAPRLSRVPASVEAARRTWRGAT